MSLTQLFIHIRKHTDSEGQAILDSIYKGLRRYEPNYAYDALKYCLNNDITPDEMKLLDAPSLLDDLEESTGKFFVPQPQQVNAYKRDMVRFFEYMRAFLELGRLDGARDILTFYPKMFHQEGKKICGSVRSRCVLAGLRDSPDRCMYKYKAGEYVCPKCDSPRSLCKKRPMQNGRCGKSGMGKGHGGQKPKGALSPAFIDGRRSPNRGDMFATQLKNRPDLRQMYIESLADPDYISLLPEISLLAARRGELLAQLDDLDPAQIETEVRGHVTKIRKAIEEERTLTVFHHAQQIEQLLDRGKENRTRWHEMNQIAGQMARLADTERKRLVEAKKAVPIQDMLRLQQETIKAVRAAIISGSEVVYREIISADEKGILDNLNPDHIKRTMLRHMADQIQPPEPENVVEGEVVEDGED